MVKVLNREAIQRMNGRGTGSVGSGGSSEGGGGSSDISRYAYEAGKLSENSEDWNKILRKDIADTAREVITFAKGLIATLKSYFNGGIEVTGGTKTDTLNVTQDATVGRDLGVQRNVAIGGNATVTGNVAAAQLIANLLKTPGFQEAIGMIGLGFGVTTDSQGRATLQTDDLLVLGRMIVNSLNIREVSYIGGTYLLTTAGSTVAKVQNLYASGTQSYSWNWSTSGSGTVVGYRVLWKADDGTTGTMNYWHQGDQAFCQTFNITEPGNYTQASNQRYWRLVCRVGQWTDENGDVWHFADLANIATVYLRTSGGSTIYNVNGGTSFAGYENANGSVPQAEDKVVCLGSQADTTRQGAVQITAEGTASIGIYDGIGDYRPLNNYEIHYFSKEAVRMNASRFRWTTTDGQSHTPSVYMGAWTTGAVSVYGYEWSYNGANWRCIIPVGQSTTEAPGTTAAYWEKNQGPQGPQGNQGPQGPQGNDGQTVYTAQVFKAASSQPSAPSGSSVPPSGWLLNPPMPVLTVSSAAGQNGGFSVAGGAHEGWRVAYGLSQNNRFVSDLVSFNTTQANQTITIEIEASSEAGYDYIFVGDLDVNVTSRPSSTPANAVSGTGKMRVVLAVPTPGSHFVTVAFTKDSSSQANEDCAWYRFIPSAQIWISTGKVVDGALQGSWSTPVEWNSPNEETYAQIIATNQRISQSINRGYRNYILNPKATDAAIGVGSMSQVSDPVMGNVMNVYNANNGDFQLSCQFDDDNRADLTGQVVTCYAVVKPKTINTSYGVGNLDFGIWSTGSYEKAGLLYATSLSEGVVSNVGSSESGATTGLTPIGNGWYVVWASFNAGSIFSQVKDNAGINSVNGSRWLVYGYGIVVGDTCPSLEAILTNTGLRSTGIDITDGLIDLRADKVKFSNSNGTVSGKVWIDPTYGTIHATDGDFSGEVTATSGNIGGFTIDTDRLYNSNWNAGVDINYDGKTVKIGKNAQGVMNTEDAIIRAENTKTLGGSYNTALYLNASGATYNYAFYGNGNGVLNGLVFGYKVQLYTIPSGNTDTISYLNIIGGSTIILNGSHSSGIVSITAPKLPDVRNCLGINSSTTPFAIEFTVISHASYEHVSIIFRTANTGIEDDNYLPWLMNEDDIHLIYGDANIQIAQGDVVKILLVYDNVGTTSSPNYEYRAYDLIRRV